jgi:uncharacterized protein
MNIKQTDDAKKGFFLADDNSAEAGKMTYVWAGNNKIIIDHTEIYSEYAGKGVGKLLLLEAVAYARSKEIKVLPLCPFAKSVFDKNPELADVLF